MAYRTSRVSTSRDRSIVLAVIVLAASGLSACGTRPAGVARPPISVSFALQHDRVAAGTVIPGVATLTNNTGKSVTVETCARNGWLDVGLTSPSIPYRPGNGAVGCPPTVHLKPGPNHFPIEIWTTYLECTPLRTAVSEKEDLPSAFPEGCLPCLRGTT